MALPIPPNNSISGSGDQQMKAVILGWIRDEIARASQGGAGLHVDGATRNLIIDQGEVQSGNYVAGSAGWALTPTGDAEFAGAVTIDGALTIASGLLQGITYVEPDFGYAHGGAYAIPAGQASRITQASFGLTVPAGFTQALIAASTRDIGVNSTAGFDYLNSFIQISVGGAYAWMPSATVPAGYAGVSVSTVTTLLTGLTGGTVITVSSQPYTTTNAWASSASNGTNLNATVLYLR